MKKEIWKDVVGYEGLYQVSNLGNVKSLKRIGKYRDSYRVIKEKILKNIKDNTGYLKVNLYCDGIQTKKHIHVLVAVSFLNHIPCGHKLVVDHINNNKLDNRVENLQIITQRYNLSKDKKGTSHFTGVYWHKNYKKWCSQIIVNNRTIYLGSFKTEEEGHNAYKNALKNI